MLIFCHFQDIFYELKEVRIKDQPGLQELQIFLPHHIKELPLDEPILDLHNETILDGLHPLIKQQIRILTPTRRPIPIPPARRLLAPERLRLQIRDIELRHHIIIELIPLLRIPNKRVVVT